MTKTSGIYKLSINNNFYIGSSTYLKKRLTNHKSQLKTNTHSNPNMLAAYKECQELKSEILELCTKEELLIREQVYIDQFFGTENCMNINSSAKPIAPIITPEINNKRKKAALAKNSKPIKVIKDNGEIINFESTSVAAKALNVPKETLRQWVKNLSKPTHYKEYIGWLFYSERP